MSSPVAAGSVPDAVFDQAADVVRVTLAVYEAAAARRDEAEQVLAALQCRHTFLIPDVDPEWGPFEYEDECELPAGHTGDHAPIPVVGDGPWEYRAALAAYGAAVSSARDAREAWEAAEETLNALYCGQMPEGDAASPCVGRRGHGDDVPHTYPTVMRIVF